MASTSAALGTVALLLPLIVLLSAILAVAFSMPIICVIAALLLAFHVILVVLLPIVLALATAVLIIRARVKAALGILVITSGKFFSVVSCLEVKIFGLRVWEGAHGEGAEEESQDKAFEKHVE